MYIFTNILSEKLGNLHKRSSSWCHNSFDEILFKLKDKYDCKTW